MGAENGNNTVSGVCMTVGLDLSLKARRQDDRGISHRC